MSIRQVMLAIALLPFAACGTPEVATPGFTDELAASAAPAPMHSSTLACPAGPGIVSAP